MTEFDRYAGSYEEMHAASVRASGEAPEYFARYKVRVLERLLGRRFGRPILDFGCGIGRLTGLLAEAFERVDGFDPSEESLKIARDRAPGATFYGDVAELPEGGYGAIVLANVLHHVPRGGRERLVASLVDRLGAGGRLVVFEHNPMNPLTRRAVALCPFDEDAELLYPWDVHRLLRGGRLEGVTLDFIVFFPSSLRALRPLEPRLAWLPAGAQVCAWGTKG